MAWKPVPNLRMSETPPDWKTIERAYAGMSQDQLLEQLTRINEALGHQTRLDVTQQIRSRVASDLDQPVIRSPKTDAQSRPADHDRQRSRPSQPTALDLLISGKRMGPRLAQRLTLASARARSR